MGLLLIAGLFIVYLKSNLNNSFEESEIKDLVSEIKLARNLPNGFITAYNLIHPITSTTNIILDWIFEKGSRTCPCLDVASVSRNLTLKNSRITGNRYALAWKLEKQLSQRECLNYLGTKYDLLYQCIGLEEASKYYFNQELDFLSNKQFVVLALMMQNPSYYNPKRNPEIIEEKLKDFGFTSN